MQVVVLVWRIGGWQATLVAEAAKVESPALFSTVTIESIEVAVIAGEKYCIIHDVGRGSDAITRRETPECLSGCRVQRPKNATVIAEIEDPVCYLE
jgi:hypothetical protein